MSAVCTLMAKKMLAKACVTFGVLVYALVIPYLEINPSHVFNDAWPPHARLHEVWQLTTHCALGLLAVWLAWWRDEVGVASLLNVCVMGGVLVAHVLADGYGGSIHSGNLESAVLGVPVAVFAAGIVVVLATAALWLGVPYRDNSV